MEKELRNPDNIYVSYFGPYTPYVEDKSKNYCISFTHYYPKKFTNYKTLFPPCLYKNIPNGKILEDEKYVDNIKENLKNFYELCSEILKYFHKKPRISYDSENSVINKDENIICTINICFFCSDKIYDFFTFLLPYFFPKTCEHRIKEILDSINIIQNENCKKQLYSKIQVDKN